MSLRDKTIEELEVIEEELNEQEEEHGYSNYSMKIEVYKEMYRKLSQLVRKHNIVQKRYLPLDMISRWWIPLFQTHIPQMSADYDGN